MNERDRQIEELQKELRNKSEALEQKDRRPTELERQVTSLSAQLEQTLTSARESSIKVPSRPARNMVEYKNLDWDSYKGGTVISLPLHHNCNAMNICEQKIIISLYRSLRVYSLDGDLVNTVQYNCASGSFISFVAVTSEQFIVADRDKGLFLLDKDGNCLQELCKESFSDLHLYCDKVYGLDEQHGTVVVFELIQQSWTKSQTISLSQFPKANYAVRIRLHNDRIYISYCNECLYIYNTQGGLLSTYGQRGNDVTKLNAGFLCGPYLCDVDNSGTALLADCWNLRIQTCTSTGEWKVVTTGMNYPVCVIVTDNSIWFPDPCSAVYELRKKLH